MMFDYMNMLQFFKKKETMYTTLVPQTVYTLYHFPIKIYLETFVSIYHLSIFYNSNITSQPAITCSKLTIETLEQSVKYVPN